MDAGGVGVSTNVKIGINYVRQVNKPLNLAALFTPTACTVRQINCVQNRTVMPVALIISSKPQKHKRRIRRILVLNANLPRQDAGHIYAVCLVMPRFMVATDDTDDLVRDGCKQVLTYGQLVHWRQCIAVGISHGGLDSAIHQISRKYAICVIMLCHIRYIPLDCIVVAVRVCIVIISQHKQLYRFKRCRQVGSNRSQ